MERHQQDPELAELVRRTEEANAALLNGQIDRYVALTPHAEDFTLMPPFGGVTRGFDTSPERQAAMARFFRSGAGALEVVQAHASGDLAFLAVIERQRAAVADLPEQDWSLRVTLVFRREGAGWRLLHRHADPLVQGRDVAQTAALARR